MRPARRARRGPHGGRGRDRRHARPQPADRRAGRRGQARRRAASPASGRPRSSRWSRTRCPGVRRAFVIAGSDQRGTIYGAYDVSKQIGVSPWYWWDDVPARHRDALYVLPGRHTQGTPTVKYRGFFINDENPALGTLGAALLRPGQGARLPERLQPQLLRQGLRDHAAAQGQLPVARGLGPGVRRGRSAQPRDRQALRRRHGHLARGADDARHRGVEPARRAAVGQDGTSPRPRPYGGTGEWSFRRNADAIKAYWPDGIQRMVDEDFEGVVTLGMRGNGDVSLPDGDGIELMQEIIASRAARSSPTARQGLDDVPQVWTLYKEVQRYWDQGLRAPDDVTVVFTDDNWGNMRKLPDQSAAAAQRRLRPVLPLRLRRRRPQLQVGRHQPTCPTLGPAEPGVRVRGRPAVGRQRRRPEERGAADRSSSSTTPGTRTAGRSTRLGEWERAVRRAELRAERGRGDRRRAARLRRSCSRGASPSCSTAGSASTRPRTWPRTRRRSSTTTRATRSASTTTARWTGSPRSGRRWRRGPSGSGARSRRPGRTPTTSWCCYQVKATANLYALRARGVHEHPLRRRRAAPPPTTWRDVDRGPVRRRPGDVGRTTTTTLAGGKWKGLPDAAADRLRRRGALRPERAVAAAGAQQRGAART